MSERGDGDGTEEAPLRALTAAVFVTSVAALMFQLLQSVTLSLQVIHTTGFLVISLVMFGLGAGGSLASMLMRRGMTRSRGWLWGIASTLLAGSLCYLLAAGYLLLQPGERSS